jgi:hypothetical protein
MLLKLGRDWGIFAAICCVFIYWGQTEKNQLNARLDKQNEFIQGKLLEKLQENTDVLRRVEQYVKQTNKAIEEQTTGEKP